MTPKQKATLVGLRAFFCDIDEDQDIVESFDVNPMKYTQEMINAGLVWETLEDTDPDIIVECVRAIEYDIMTFVLGFEPEEFEE